MSNNFVHLHNHSEYSLLDGACRVKDLIGQVANLGMPAVAITDHGVLYGVIDFYREAKKRGIKPIIGCEVYVAPRSRLDKEARIDDKIFHLVLLAKDKEGYNNLLQLVSRAFLEGFYYKPRVDMELLEKYNKGLIALSGCIAGEIPQLILAGKTTEAEKKASYYNEIFGFGNFYLELQDHGLAEEKQVCSALCRISDATGIPVVASNDVHYVHQKDAAAHDVLLCIQTGTVVNNEERMRFPNSSFYMKSEEEMKAIFAYRQDAIDNTIIIAEKCNVDFNFGEFHLPYFNLPEGYSAETFLQEMVYEKFPLKYPNPNADIIQRLEYELKTINSMGFAAYFLIVQDLVNWAKENRVAVGPGRGSAAGSLVSYVLGITSIDPIEYDLLFERFLNPERVSMPDIDIDFCFEKREKVINYIIEKYGADRVAQIITFGTMAARAAIRDVGRVLDIPYSEVDKVARMIPSELGVTIERAMEMSQDLIQAYQSDYTVRRIIDMAKALEGMPRHASIHAAGVVIGKEELSSLLPLQKTTDGHVVTQFTKETVEDIGLLKMDILGLRTLTVIDRAVEIIEKTRGINIDINNIPLNDPQVFKLLSQGDTVGVFQLESDGLRRILREIVPSRFEDLIAIIALYRPGPLGSGMVEDFINCKHGQQKIEYIHPMLEDILKETYGVILYQEQVMRIASDLGNFTMGEADILRRAMGKKRPEELASLKDKFIAGANKNKVSEDIAKRLFDLMESFAGYGFNKSHSAAYAMISYQTAYLKTYFTVEYMCAFLSSVIDNQDRIVFYLKECQRLGIPILPPDINESFENFTVTRNSIRFGLEAIRNVGLTAVKNIVKIRKENRFSSLFDFCRRIDLAQVNKRMLENLISAGCFDSLNISRKQALSIIAECIDLSIKIKHSKSSNQISLFGDIESMIEEPVPKVNGEFPKLELLKREKEVLGFYVSANPLDEYRQLLPFIITHQISELNSTDDESYVRVAGILESLQRKVSRKGDSYARFHLEDFSGRIEVIAFPFAYRSNIKRIEPDTAVVVEGYFDTRDEQPKISLRKIQPISPVLKELYICIPDDNDAQHIRTRLLSIIKKYPGNIEVIVQFAGNRAVILNEDYDVEANIDFMKELVLICGKNNIWFN
jgi:DNA polymerase-3 subunit alpha